MKDYNLGVLQPGEERDINAFGDYVRNIGTGSVKVIARNLDKSVKAFSTVLGSGGWRSPESEYNHWVITNDSAVALPVSVLIGKGEAGESNVQINADVNALVRADNLSIDGNQFIGGFNDAAQTSYSNVCLWNPVGSGVDVVVSKLLLNGDVSNCNVGYDVTNIGYNKVSADQYLSKKFGSPNGKASIYSYFSDYTLTYINNNIYKISALPLDSSSGVTSIDFKASPFIVAEGYMFVVWGGALNSRLSATFEYSEVSI